MSRAAPCERLPMVLLWVLLLVACATPRTHETFVSTALYPVELTFNEGMIPKPAASGGGMEELGDDVLLVTGEGNFHLLEWASDSDELTLRTLPYRVPINRKEFVDLHGVNWESYRFRVGDVLVKPGSDTLRILVSHHYWKPEERCSVVRVSARDDRRDEFLDGTSKSAWTTLYETSPCLPLKETGRGHAFGGQQYGGRLASLDEDTFLLTVGDHQYDGWNAEETYPQDPEGSYGLILAIDSHSGAARTFSLGHRNPQGLYIDPDNVIWSTEHGPQGGDELNRIERGANYGWPYVTYGTEYGTHAWPLNDRQGRHEGYVEPVYAWVPSIGVSDLAGVERDGFPGWKGDLLIASLMDETLHRVRLSEGRVIYIEPIPIGKATRDVIEARDGRIVLWTDDGSVVSLKPAVASDNAELVFATRCGGCHPVRDGSRHGIGPDLWGISGRAVASAEGFQYSQALSSTQGRWTDERLDSFLADPVGVVPGTSMQSEGVADAARRAALVRYLQGLD
jgi:cytochrome c2